MVSTCSSGFPYNRRMRLPTFLGISLLALAVAASVAAMAHADSRSDKVRAELSELRDHIAQVRKQITADTHQRSDLSDALAEAQARISRARKHLDQLDSGIAEHKKRIDRLKKQRDAERDHLTGELDTLRKQVQAAYETGRMSRMRLLLSGAAPERIGRMLTYYRYFSDAQSEQVEHLKTILGKLASKQQSLENERAQLASEYETRKQTLAALQETQKKQKATLAALDKQLSKRKTSLSSMKSHEKKLTQLLASISRAVSRRPAPPPPGTPFHNRKGHMKAPVSGHVAASFGQPKHGGPLRWQGTLFAAPEGTPVHAVASGRVVYVGFLNSYGLIIIVNHGQGYYSLYGHAASSYVDVGDAVSAGQAIGTAGHSGGHRTNGIYFEIRHNQTPINPGRWLSS